MLSHSDSFLCMYAFLLLLFFSFVCLGLTIIFPFFQLLFFCFRFVAMIISKWCNNSTRSRYRLFVRSFIYKHCFYICKSLMESVFFAMITIFLLRCCSLFSMCTALDDFLSLSLYFRSNAHFSPPMDFTSLWMNLQLICMHEIHSNLCVYVRDVILWSVAIYIDSGR